SAQAGIIHVATAKDAIANIPADYDAALFDRDFQIDPARARDNLASGQYPNIGPEKRTELARAADEALGQLSQEAVQPGEEDFPEPHDGGPATPDQGQAQNGDQGGPRDQERQDQNQAAQETAESKRGAAPRANEKPNPQQQPSEKPAASNEPSKNEKKEGGLSLMAVKDIISKLNVSEETKARLIKLAELGYMMDAEGAGKYTGPYNGPRAPAVADRIQDLHQGSSGRKNPREERGGQYSKRRGQK
ncbi:MAG: hypothetical protein ACREMY_29615, partial [bacterium]